VISFLELLPKNECHILENKITGREALSIALDNAVRTNIFNDIKDPVAWQREIRKDRALPGREE
jgi:hypothetical protein